MSLSRVAITGNTFAAASSPGNHAHGATGTSVFAALVICYNMPNTATNSVSSVTDSNGNVWTKTYSTSMTQLSAVSPGPSVNCFVAIEVWTTNGATFTTAGTFTFSFGSNIDGCSYVFHAWRGADPANPLDINSSLPLKANVTASANCGGSISTSTGDILIAMVGVNLYGTVRGDGKIGSFTVNNDNQGVFSGATQTMRFYYDYTTEGAITAPQSGLAVGWTSGLSTGPVTNMLMIAYAVTADVAPAGPPSKTTATVIH